MIIDGLSVGTLFEVKAFQIFAFHYENLKAN